MPHVGDVIEISGRRFLLENGIGAHGNGERGGFGEVFAAREINAQSNPVGPSVAVKLVERSLMRQHRETYENGEVSAERQFVNNLKQEGEALCLLADRHGALRTINVIGYVHHGMMRFPDEDRAYPAVVMQRATCTLAHVLAAKDGGRLALRRRLLTCEGVIALLVGLARALSALSVMADGRLCAHRDIKPKNVLLVGEHYLLSDFGSLKKYDNNTFSIGPHTPDFTAPELWRAIKRQNELGESDVAVSYATADVYALGMVMLMVLQGRLPLRQCDWELATGTDLLLPVEREKLAGVICALPAQGRVEDADTVVPLRRPDARAVGQFQSGLFQLVLDMIQLSPGDRPSASVMLRRAEMLQGKLLGGRGSGPLPQRSGEAVAARSRSRGASANRSEWMTNQKRQQRPVRVPSMFAAWVLGWLRS